MGAKAGKIEGFRASLVLLNREERTIRSIALVETEEELEAAQPRFEEIRNSVPPELRERVEASGRRGPVLERRAKC